MGEKTLKIWGGCKKHSQVQGMGAHLELHLALGGQLWLTRSMPGKTAQEAAPNLDGSRHRARPCGLHWRAGFWLHLAASACSYSSPSPTEPHQELLQAPEREKLEEKTIKTKHVPVKKNYIFCQGSARGTGSKVLPIIFYYRAKVLIKRNKKSSHFDLFPELDMV